MATVHNMCDLAVAHGRLASGWTPVLVMPFYLTKITTIIVMITDTFCMLGQSCTLLVCVYIQNSAHDRACTYPMFRFTICKLEHDDKLLHGQVSAIPQTEYTCISKHKGRVCLTSHVGVSVVQIGA